MPSYIEIIQMLDIPKLSIMKIFRLLKYLVYIYDTNKRNCYTDSHEQEDIIDDKITCFLVQYFLAEYCARRWVQLIIEMSQKLKK